MVLPWSCRRSVRPEALQLQIFKRQKNFSWSIRLEKNKKGWRMALTRDYKETVKERAQQDPNFSRALFDEALSLFLNGEADTARLVLRDLVNATVGFEELAVEVAMPSKSLHRMLSANGNPTMDSLTQIFKILKKKLGINIQVQSVSCH